MVAHEPQGKMHSLKGLHGSPSVWLERFINLFTPTKVLDLACGCGRNTAYLASWGNEVTAVDVDDRVGPYIRKIPNTRFICANLESEEWPLGEMKFGAIVVNFYLYRPILPKLADMLLPGGYLIYETFMMPYQGFDGNRAKNGDFVLKPLELVERYQTTLSTIAYEQTLSEKGDCFQRYLGRKPINSFDYPVLLSDL